MIFFKPSNLFLHRIFGMKFIHFSSMDYHSADGTLHSFFNVFRSIFNPKPRFRIGSEQFCWKIKNSPKSLILISDSSTFPIQNVNSFTHPLELRLIAFSLNFSAVLQVVWCDWKSPLCKVGNRSNFIPRNIGKWF